jgi:hypothetical protein
MSGVGHSLREVFGVLNQMVDEKVVDGYAVVGAMAVLFYAEPARTYDLDVAVALPQSGGLFSLAGVYEWLAKRHFIAEGEHVSIFGVPVQFLPGDTGLWGETVREARRMDYGGEPVQVASPEYLVALAGLAPSAKRRERIAQLLESQAVDERKLAEILERHGLSPT